MRRQVITIHADATLLKATQLMRHNRIGGLPVVDQEKHVVGIVTRSDLLDFLIEQLGPGHEEARTFQKEAV
jgi:CBS domain-containing protein